MKTNWNWNLELPTRNLNLNLFLSFFSGFVLKGLVQMVQLLGLNIQSSFLFWCVSYFLLLVRNRKVANSCATHILKVKYTLEGCVIVCFSCYSRKVYDLTHSFIKLVLGVHILWHGWFCWKVKPKLIWSWWYLQVG